MEWQIDGRRLFPVEDVDIIELRKEPYGHNVELGFKCYFCGHYSSIHKGGHCFGFVLDDKGILDCDCTGVSR